jgi:hypothetical protein
MRQDNAYGDVEAPHGFSSATLYRVVAKTQNAGKTPTLLLNEADTYIDGNEEFRGILNQGWERENASTWRCDGEGFEPTEFSTWAPAAIAKIGTLSDTILDRSIVVKLKRKLPTEHVATLDKAAKANLVSLQQRAAQWAQEKIAVLEDAAPAMPPSLAHDDRAQDNWRPLLAIADVVRDPWPQIARMAASMLAGSGEDPTLAVKLLSDIRDVFARCGADRLTSEMLCSKLEHSHIG